MNDPNGLFYHAGLYHLYYQLNPIADVFGQMHWGHAVSADLFHWRTRGLALFPDADGLAYSGSAVVDSANRSGIFPADDPGGPVAIYTRAAPGHQRQEVAISRDGGDTFTVVVGAGLDIDSASFRDPKVIWHEPSGRWVMAVSRAKERIVEFYGSGDLRHWQRLGDFGPSGLAGGDWECPCLAELPVQGGGTRWVLFVSVNPGAPLGGGCVQCFVGEFDGRRFLPDDRLDRLVDFGPDFYALQTWNGAPGEPVAIAWAANWLYASQTPSSGWRGQMTLPRRLGLMRDNGNWRLTQRFEPLAALRALRLLPNSLDIAAGGRRRVALPVGRAVEVRFDVLPKPKSRLSIRFANGLGEAVELLWDAGCGGALAIDRSWARGFTHDHLVAKAMWSAPPLHEILDVHVVFDRSSVEVLAAGGTTSCTMQHWFSESPDRLEIVAADGAVQLMNVEAFALNATV